jgi:hypothetical protein
MTNVFSTNGVNTTAYLQTREWSWMLASQGLQVISEEMVITSKT